MKKALIKLGWEPRIKFKELVKMMVEHDLKEAQKEAYLNEKMNQTKDENINDFSPFRISF